MDISYGEKEIRIVKDGIQEIESVLFGSDTSAKERLLFYLDWYLDPYYKNDLSNIIGDISIVLQKLVVESSEYDIVEESIHLLSTHLFGPYKVLEEHMADIPDNIKTDIFIG